MKLSDLQEKRAKLFDEARAAHEANDNEKFVALENDIADLDQRIERQAKIDDFDRRAQGEVISGTGDQKLDAECRQFSLVKALAGSAGLNVDWGREREIQGELAKRAGKNPEGVLVPMEVFEKRVLTTAAPVAGPGSNIISTDHFGNQFIDTLRNALVIRRLGARVLNGLVGNVDIPKLKASATAGWVAENAALSSSDHQMSKVSMTPKHAGALTELSRNMLQQSSPDIEQLVRDDFAAILAEAVDTVALNGGGSNEPTGIIANSDVTETTWGTGDSYIEVAADMIAALDTNNANAMRSFLTTPEIRADAVKIKTTDGLPITIGQHFHDEPVMFSNLVPKTLGGGSEHGIIYGDWTDLMIGYWSAFDLLVNPFESTAYSKGNVQVRAMLTCDVAVRHAESFTYTSQTPA